MCTLLSFNIVVVLEVTTLALTQLRPHPCRALNPPSPASVQAASPLDHGLVDSLAARGISGRISVLESYTQ